jgi:signal transduction histidine kinase/ActR/RegA family two-component response regulator
MNRQRFIRPYMWTIITLGAAACLYALLNLPFARLDLRFAMLAAVTLFISSRLCVPIPRTTGEISVSDIFIYLTMMLYDGEAAILLAAAELFSASRFGRKPKSLFTSLFNAAMMASSTLITVCALRFLFGSITELAHGQFSATFVAALCVMGFVQYITNSTIAAIHTACKANEPLWLTWRKVYLWTSITYFAGASGAGLIAKVTAVVGLYAIIATLPIIAIVYFTYRTYLENIAAMATAAEAAKAEAEAAKAKAAAEAKAEAQAAKAETEAAKALAAAEQAEQARRHVEELNHYIAEQERIREQYAQIEKLSALGELASGVAHDFNNTLAGILGRAQLLLSTSDPLKIESGLRLIIKTAKDGAKTIKRIQDFARQRRDHDFQPVSMDQLLLDVREITRPRWKNRAEAAGVHIKLELQLRSDNALVMGDESELREVLVNLVFNAVDAMPQGGTLKLSTKETGDVVEIDARDTGVGMSEEVRSRIFDPFFTTKGKTGMGLGLAVSYGIIRRHEGTIEVHSEVGRGTCFRLRLPIARGAVKTRSTSELPVIMAASPSSAPKSILVVDDEGHVRELLRDILEKEGCRVSLAEGGHEALTLFDAARYDAVFTDLGMPGMSGWELACAVRERDEQIPLAVITGWGEAVGSNEQKAARVNWVVAKPFDTEQIIEIVRDISCHRDDFAADVVSIVAA